MRAFSFCCLQDNRVQNQPWGKLWGKVRSERGRFQPSKGYRSVYGRADNPRRSR
jgi:hypothetical protein